MEDFGFVLQVGKKSPGDFLQHNVTKEGVQIEGTSKLESTHQTGILTYTIAAILKAAKTMATLQLNINETGLSGATLKQLDKFNADAAEAITERDAIEDRAGLSMPLLKITVDDLDSIRRELRGSRLANAQRRLRLAHKRSALIKKLVSDGTTAVTDAEAALEKVKTETRDELRRLGLDPTNKLKVGLNLQAAEIQLEHLVCGRDAVQDARHKFEDSKVHVQNLIRLSRENELVEADAAKDCRAVIELYCVIRN